MKIKTNITQKGSTLSGHILDVDFEDGKRGDADVGSKDGEFLVLSGQCPILYDTMLSVWGRHPEADNNCVVYTYDSPEEAKQVLSYINEFNMEED